MKCQICHKNEANIVFTQIVNNEKIVLQICSDCAKEKGVSIEFTKPSQPKSTVPFPGIMGGADAQDDDDEIPDLTCDGCGLTYAEFKKGGLFGCDRCHVAFGDHIQKLLRQIHGTSLYGGKLPETPSEDSKKLRTLHQLRKELTRCIEREEYEHAAQIRDRIAELEAGNVKSR